MKSQPPKPNGGLTAAQLHDALQDAFVQHEKTDALHFDLLGEKLGELKGEVGEIRKSLAGDGTQRGAGIVERVTVLETITTSFHKKSFAIASVLLPLVVAGIVYLFNRVYLNSEALATIPGVARSLAEENRKSFEPRHVE